ncbi:prolyl oligopeptidase family serine peptidase [Stenotrophomonas sp.]|uniref:alpha/beta hydrolase family protein n=1 Tax=Stenotrophomonas sp. TaxID=69392 RepID=UPI002FCA78C7
MHARVWIMRLCVAVACLPGAAGAVDLEAFLRDEAFDDLQLSPDGRYLAATIPLEDSTAVAILGSQDMKLVGSFRPPRNNHAINVDWVSNERVLVGLGEKLGRLEEPMATGELYAIDADGKAGELLIGYRARRQQVATADGPERSGLVVAFLTDELAADDRHALVAVTPVIGSAFTRIERIDVVTGKRELVVQSPVAGASFTTDNSGTVRFARGAGADNVDKLYYRADGAADWTLVNDQSASQRIELPIGFSADNQLAYLWAEQPTGPDAIISWNPQTDERRTVLRDAVVDPGRVIFQPGTRVPVGALFLGDVPRARFFDDTSSTARLYRTLQAALEGPVHVTSSTRDGRAVVVNTWSGSNPGDFYLYDTTTRVARHLASRSEWIDPARSAQVRPIALSARDGLPLHGFLTVPHGSDGRNLPMVVMPHGGPFGLFDSGRYDAEAQLLAAAGYAVLQVNFRGSANYGRAHTEAGRQQWGAAMQDDVTDATRWAIAQGVADKARICIYGASYGAYAAMMGAAREPGLYQCAAGYVGIYDLPMMYRRGDIRRGASGRTYLSEWLGTPEQLAARSPLALAAQIRVPVFLAAGGQDTRAPMVHSRRLEAALKRAGTPVESLYYFSEGHGFYARDHQRELYRRLLAFLSRSLGGQLASAPAPAEARKAP